MIAALDETLENSENQIAVLEEAQGFNTIVSLQIRSLTGSITQATQYIEEIEEKKEEVIRVIDYIAAAAQENSANTKQASANLEEILATLEEFSSHVNHLQNISEELNKEVTNVDFKQPLSHPQPCVSEDLAESMI